MQRMLLTNRKGDSSSEAIEGLIEGFSGSADTARIEGSLSFLAGMMFQEEAWQTGNMSKCRSMVCSCFFGGPAFPRCSNRIPYRKLGKRF